MLTQLTDLHRIAPHGRVLVVDDESDVREAVETALELEGHRVATAVDGLGR
jgi:two-component system response regulator MprA